MANFELNVKVNGVEQVVSTIGGLEQALADTNKQLQGVEQNSKEFQFLQNQAQNLEKVMGALTQDAQKLNNGLKGVSASAKTLNQNFNQAAQAATNFETAGTDAVQTVGQEAEKSSGKMNNLRTELRKITIELQNLEPGSARFQELSLRAGQLRDEIADTNAVVTALAGNVTERFARALTSSLQIGVAGFQAVTAAQQLFGSENEQVNKALAQFGALLNLSQALETFGALPDKLREISAGFGLVSSGATTATSAIAAETVATEGATVATTGLGLAMKALPIVALLAGLATLVSIVYSYATASDKAKKSQEERKKKEEELAKAQKEQVQTLAKESGELLLLLTRLKETNSGTAERTKLIKQINKEYGTTLKNYADEEKFLQQVNGAIIDYISITKLKFKLQKNDEYYQKQLEQSYDAEIKLSKARTDANKNFALSADQRKAALGDQEAEARFLTQLGQKYRDVNLERTFEYQQYAKIRDEVKKLQKQYEDSQESLLKLANRRNELIKEENEETKKLFPNQDKVNASTTTSIKLKKDETALAQFTISLLKERQQEEIRAAEEKAKATKSIVDDIELEKLIALRSLEDQKKEALKKDEEEFKSKQKKKRENVAIETAYNEEVARIESAFLVRRQRALFEDAVARQAIKDELLLQQTILNQEIIFGDNNVADQISQNQQRINKIRIDQIDSEIENNKLSVAEYSNLLGEKLFLQQQYNDEQLKIDLKVAEATNFRELTNFIKLQEQLLGVTIRFNKQEKDETDQQYKDRIAQDGQYIFTRIDGTEACLSDLTDLEKLSYDNIIKAKGNLDEQYNVTKTEITANYTRTNAKLERDTDKQTFDYKLNLLKQYFSAASATLQSYQSTQLAGFGSILDQTLIGIGEFLRLSEEEFATTTDKVAAYATAISGVLNGVINGFIQANQAQAQAELDEAQRLTDAKIDGYTQTYNAAVELQKQQYSEGLITEQQYNDAVKALQDTYNGQTKAANEALSKEQYKIKEKAFKDEKNLKIAQAIVSGLQGAVQAFAAAMQLGPIAGPIVGALLAAAVAGLAAANVAQIKKVQFSGGQQVSQASSTLPSTPTASAAGSSLAQASGGGFTSFSQTATGGTAPTTTGATTPFSGMQKVYVLESDITATQNRVKVLENNASFG